MERASGKMIVPTDPEVLRGLEEVAENAAQGGAGFLIMRVNEQRLFVERLCLGAHVVLPQNFKEDDDSDASFDALEGLPLEIKMYILAILSPASLATCATLSRAWRSLVNLPLLWHAKVQAEFPNSCIRGVAANAYRHLYHAATYREAYLWMRKRSAKWGYFPATYEQMCAMLPPFSCRVILFNLPCDISDQFKMLTVYMVWAPDVVPLKEKLLAVTYSTALKMSKPVKIDLEAQASELSEMTLEDMQDNLQRKIHAGATVRGVDASRFVLRM